MTTDSAVLASFRLRLVATPRGKVVTIFSAVGAALFGGFMWFYWRKRKKYERSKRNETAGAVEVDVPRRGPTVGLPPLKPSSSSLSVHQRRRTSTSRSTSGSAVGQHFSTSLSLTGMPASTVASRLIHTGLECLTESVAHFERSTRTLKDSKSLSRHDRELLECVENALEATKSLQTDIIKLVEGHCPEAFDEVSIASTITPMGSQFAIHDMSRVRRTLSVLSDDSFVSALEEVVNVALFGYIIYLQGTAPSFPDVEAPVLETAVLPFEDLEFYQVGWKKVQEGEVQCRCVRTEFLRCLSDDDFLAKLYCVREALAIIMADSTKRGWIANAGRELLAALLQHAGKDPSGFYKAYDDMLHFIDEQEDWTSVQDELSYRQVTQITFYDVVLDFIMMDAFDDLAHPPPSVYAVAQNRFFSASFKEKTLVAVVWSVIKAKRTRLRYGHGFISHFYDIAEQVSPTMAWGFLGTDESLREVCYYFKDQVCCFLSDMFSVDRVRYTTLDDLSHDVYEICQSRMETTLQRLAPPKRPNTPSLSSPSPSHSNHVDSNGVSDEFVDA